MENENKCSQENVSPCGSKGKECKKNDKKKEKNKNTKNRNRDKGSQDDDWICQDCGDHWDDDGEDHWIICDLCGSKFHLQCSGIQYRSSQYWTLDLDNIYFECDRCKQIIKKVAIFK